VLYAVGALVIAPAGWFLIMLFLMATPRSIFALHPWEMLIGGWICLAFLGALYPRVVKRMAPSWYAETFVGPCARGLLLAIGSVSGLVAIVLVLCLLLDLLLSKTGLADLIATEIDD